MSNSPIRITNDELFSPEINDVVETQQALNREIGAVSDQPWLIRVIYANWFYLAVCAGLGGFVGGLVLEPFFDDSAMAEGEIQIGAILIFPAVAGAIGLFLGAAEGLMCRNGSRAIINGTVGAAVGFFGGLVALIPTNIVFNLMQGIAISLWKNPIEGEMPTGLALVVFMMGRAAAWSIAAIPAGIGQGIALKERKVIMNGALGGVLGGLLGGFLFDPISFVFITADGEAIYSRLIGFLCIGIFVGLFVGLIEGWTKTAWLVMKKGPLAGKQFILYKDTTILGSSPKAEIYLFKDDAIEPKHAVLYNRGGRFEIEDCDTPDGTYINGIPLQGRKPLSAGDQIVLGKTVLEFSLRESDK